MYYRRYNNPPKCPKCGNDAYYRQTRGHGEYVRCRVCNAFNRHPICPSCGQKRINIHRCRSCRTQKPPVYPAKSDGATP